MQKVRRRHREGRATGAEKAADGEAFSRRRRGLSKEVHGDRGGSKEYPRGSRGAAATPSADFRARQPRRRRDPVRGLSPRAGDVARMYAAEPAQARCASPSSRSRISTTASTARTTTPSARPTRPADLIPSTFAARSFRRRVAATPRLRRGHSVESSRPARASGASCSCPGATSSRSPATTRKKRRSAPIPPRSARASVSSRRGGSSRPRSSRKT